MTDNNALDPTSLRSLWRLAWPMMIAFGSHTALAIIDMYWIGALGTDALAAVSLIGNVIFCIFGLTQVVYTSALAMVSRRIGAGNLAGRDGAQGVAVQAIHLSVIIGLLVAGTGAAIAEPSVALFGASETVTDLSVDYMVPMMLSFLPVFPFMALASIFVASGDTRTPMAVGVGANILNAALDPFLIFGWAGMPEMGVTGAGVASLTSAVVNGVALAWFFYRRTLPFPRIGPFSWFGFGAYRTLLRIGVPASLSMLTRPASTVILLGVIANFGAAGVAAFGITVRALSLVWLYHDSLSIAVSTLTGQSLGAKNVPGIRVLVRKSIGLSVCLSVLMGAVYFIWAPEIIGIFEKGNTEVLELGATFMRLLVVANLATSFSVIWAAVLNGAGDTRPPMFIAILANWALKLPLAYLLAVPWGVGVEGVWWAMFISLIFESAAIFYWFRRDHWMHARV